MVTPREAWRRQKNSAIKRGIGWDFTFNQWCAWWKCRLGKDWFSKRGCKEGHYVMARDGDEGPYAPWNVRCATVGENHVEYNGHRPVPTKHRRRRPSREEVVAIFKAKGKYIDIADKYGLALHQVQGIKLRMYYSKITSQL